jgi:hypothetical protein
MAADQLAKGITISLAGAFDQRGVGISLSPAKTHRPSARDHARSAFISPPLHTPPGFKWFPPRACEDGAVPESPPVSRVAPGLGRRLMLAATLLVLGACKVDAAVAVTTDRAGAGTVTVTITADAEVAVAAPDLATDVRVADLKAAGWTVDGPSAAADGGLSIMLSRPVTTPEDTTAVLAQLSGPGGPFHDLVVTQQRSFANIATKLTGRVELVGGLSAFVDTSIVDLLGGEPYRQALAERRLTLDQVFELRFIATTPGAVRATDGLASPVVGAGVDATNTVEWRADLGHVGGLPITLESVLRDTGAQNARRWRDFAPWAAAAWGAFFLGVVLPVSFLIRRRHRAL